MTKDKTTFAVVIILIILALLGYWYVSTQTPKQISTPATVSEQGRAVIMIKDAATSLSGVTSIAMTVDKVELQNNINAWTTVSTTPSTYDLIQLKQSGLAKLLVDATIPAGTYEQIRLHIASVQITADGKTSAVKLPSNTLKIAGTVTVKDGQVSTASLDFLADKSLHLTGSGKYILAPVIHLQTKTDADVNVKTDHSVEVVSGKTETDEDVGMDEKGEVKTNFELTETVEVDVDDHIRLNGKIVVPVEEENEAESAKTNEEDSAKTSTPITFNLMAQNNSGISGIATLTKVDGKTKVELNLNGGSASLISLSEPAHIHTGTCANIGGVKYPLTNVVSSHSVTVMNVSLNDLKASLPLAINVHKSALDMATYVACVDLTF